MRKLLLFGAVIAALIAAQGSAAADVTATEAADGSSAGPPSSLTVYGSCVAPGILTPSEPFGRGDGFSGPFNGLAYDKSNGNGGSVLGAFFRSDRNGRFSGVITCAGFEGNLPPDLLHVPPQP